MSVSGWFPIPTDRPSSIQYADPSPRTLNASEMISRPPKNAIAAARVPAIRAQRLSAAGAAGEELRARRGSRATLAPMRSVVSGGSSKGLIVAAACCLSAFALLTAETALGANPLSGRHIFMDCQAATEQSAPTYNPWYWFQHYQGRDPAKANLLGRIAKVPTVKHFAGNSIRPNPTKIVDRWMARVDDPQLGGPNCQTPLDQGERDEYVGDYPIIAFRAMVHDRCRGWSGGEWNTTSPNGLYKRWVDTFVKSLGRTWDGPGRFKYRDS